MSDVGSPGPPDDAPVPESDSASESQGLWRRYRSWPLWVQIVAPLVVIGVIVGGVIWATSASDGEMASSDTTTASGGQLELVVKGLTGEHVPKINDLVCVCDDESRGDHDDNDLNPTGDHRAGRSRHTDNRRPATNDCRAVNGGTDDAGTDDRPT